MCFRDTTFCSNDQHAPDCDRRWTPDLSAEAEGWWGGPGAPVAFAPMRSGSAAEPMNWDMSAQEVGP